MCSLKTLLLVCNYPISFLAKEGVDPNTVLGFTTAKMNVDDDVLPVECPDAPQTPTLMQYLPFLIGRLLREWRAKVQTKVDQKYGERQVKLEFRDTDVARFFWDISDSAFFISKVEIGRQAFRETQEANSETLLTSESESDKDGQEALI